MTTDLNDPPMPTSERERTTRATNPLEGKTVLVVDDHASNLQLVASYLEGLPVRVIVAQDAEWALHRARAQHPDLILMDILMPGMNGVDACTLLRADPELAQVPVIMMSALSEVTDKVKGLNAGAVDYLTKPIHSAELLVRVRVHLELAGLRQALAVQNAALVRAHEELEFRVQARTVDLAAANSALRIEVSARREAQENARHIALHDALTDLPNRTLVREGLAGAIEHARREGGEVALLLVDVDRFRNVNDSLGHQLGDLLLKSIAQRISMCVGERGTVGRVGGDEFAIWLATPAGKPCHELLAQELREAMAPVFEVKGYPHYVDVSVGISLFPASGGDAEALMRCADTALYQAKANGIGSVVLYEALMDQRIRRNLELASLLRESLAAERFNLEYQPVVCLDSGRVVGVEALIRWRGLPAPAEPAEFIAIAEDTGLIGVLGRWVRRTALQELARWRAAGHSAVRMAVNASAAEVRAPGFVADIRAELQRTGVPPSNLVVEITEGLLLNPDDRNLTALVELNALGVHLAVDDFGTGYSSLSYLRSFPLKILKIDRSFVSGMCACAEAGALPAAIIAMAHSLGMTVVAEGVETLEQEQALLELNCDFAQGFRYSRSVDAATILAMLGRGGFAMDRAAQGVGARAGVSPGPAEFAQVQT